jgi:hypothetical protein
MLFYISVVIYWQSSSAITGGDSATGITGFLTTVQVLVLAGASQYSYYYYYY